jgi:hypothetical protein
MANHLITQRWLWGGLIGLLVPGALFALFQILCCYRIAFGEHLLSALLVFAIAYLEMPVVIIGRALNLPIESGEVAFIMYSLSPFGFVLVLVFWMSAGLLFGCVVDRIAG